MKHMLIIVMLENILNIDIKAFGEIAFLIFFIKYLATKILYIIPTLERI